MSKNNLKYNAAFHQWLICFLSLNFVFLFYQTTFFWGNHDWDWIKGTTQVLKLNTGLFEGRYAKFILNTILFGGQILPILNNMIAFALLSLGCVFLSVYWRVQDKVASLCIALMVSLSPNILGWLYFPINILGNFSAIFLIVFGLMLFEKEKISAKVVAILCFVLALGVYPSVMETMVVCVCFRYLITPKKDFREIAISFAGIAFALVTFKFILFLLIKANLTIGGYYNLETLPFLELINRVPETVGLAFGQLVTVTPFFPLYIKLLTLILVTLSPLLTVRHRWQAVFWSIAFGATVLSSFLTSRPEETANMPRVNFYGLTFFYAGSAAVLLCSTKKLKKNIGIVLSFSFLFCAITLNFEAQKVWYLGKNAEEHLINRISSHIEQNAQNFPLTPVVAGELSLRPRYYHIPYQKESPYLLNRPFMVRHIPSGIFNFYAPEILFYGNSAIYALTPELYHFIKNASRSWPSADSVYIDENYALILLTPEGIRAIQAQLP